MNTQRCVRLARPTRRKTHLVTRPLCAAFSSSIYARAANPARGTSIPTMSRYSTNSHTTDLEELLSPSKTRRPDADPIASRDPSEASDARNPALQGYPAPDGSMTRSTASPDTSTPEYAPARTNQNNVPSGTSPASRSPAMGDTLAKNIRSAATQFQSASPSNPSQPSRPQRPVASATGDLASAMRNMSLPSSSQRSPLAAASRTDPKQAANIQAAASRAAGVGTREAQQFNRRVEFQQPRIWQPGDVYAPHDLSPAEATKNSRANNVSPKSLPTPPTRRTGGRDVLDALRIDPVKEYRNFAMMGEFVTEMGRIKGRRVTGLRLVNQRRLARAVRRAIGIGLVPSVHRHPELMEARGEQMGRTVPREYLRGV